MAAHEWGQNPVFPLARDMASSNITLIFGNGDAGDAGNGASRLGRTRALFFGHTRVKIELTSL